MKTNDSSSSKSILKQAFSEIVREEAALLSDTPSQPRSVAFEQKMRRLFRRQRYLESPLFNTAQKRIAVVAALAVVLIVSAVASINPIIAVASMPPNISLAVQQNSSGTDFFFTHNADNDQVEIAAPPEKLETFYTISEISAIDANFPDDEGYIKFIRDRAQKTAWTYRHINGTEIELILTQTVVNEPIHVNATKYTVTAVNGKRAFLFPQNLILIWTDGCYVFTLQATDAPLSPTVLTALAEAVCPHPLSDTLLKAYHHNLFFGGQFSDEYKANQNLYNSLP